MSFPDKWKRRLSLGRVLFEFMGMPWTVADVVAVFTSGGIFSVIVVYGLDLVRWLPRQQPVVVSIAAMAFLGFGIFFASAVNHVLKRKGQSMVTTKIAFPFTDLLPPPDPMPVHVVADVRSNKRSDEYTVELSDVEGGYANIVPCPVRWLDMKTERRPIPRGQTGKIGVATVMIVATDRPDMPDARAEMAVHAVKGSASGLGHAVAKSDDGSHRWHWAFHLTITGHEQDKVEPHLVEIDVQRRPDGLCNISGSSGLARRD